MPQLRARLLALLALRTASGRFAGERGSPYCVLPAVYAVVMVFVFGVFALMPIIDMKEMDIGLATAVLIDATIVRAVLLPATMKLFGEWNWYLPT